MTADEAREAFGEAIDGTLDEPRQKALDAALAADATLKTEYDELVAIVRETQALGAASDDTAVPDVLAGVQRKLRARSGGKFYRDRYSEKAGRGTLTPVIVAAVMLVLIGLIFLGLEWTQVVEPPSRPTATSDR